MLGASTTITCACMYSLAWSGRVVFKGQEHFITCSSPSRSSMYLARSMHDYLVNPASVTY